MGKILFQKLRNIIRKLIMNYRQTIVIGFDKEFSSIVCTDIKHLKIEFGNLMLIDEHYWKDNINVCLWCIRLDVITSIISYNPDKLLWSDGNNYDT